MEKFLDLFVRNWHNLRQAQHSPASFAYVHYEVTWDGEQLKTKQWYDYEGPDKPYRERQHNVSDMEDGKVLLETFNNFVKLADTIFVPTPEVLEDKQRMVTSIPKVEELKPRLPSRILNSLLTIKDGIEMTTYCGKKRTVCV